MSNDNLRESDVIGLLKTAVDAHTLGISIVAQLLRRCGYRAVIASEDVARSIETLGDPRSRERLLRWLDEHGITALGFSYRLDPESALARFSELVDFLDSEPRYRVGGERSNIHKLFFAGLPPSCDRVRRAYGDRFATFSGEETPAETLRKMGVPSERIHADIQQGSHYDEARMTFGLELVRQGLPDRVAAQPLPEYPEVGTPRDSLTRRMDFARRRHAWPLLRAHVGPYVPGQPREESVRLFIRWLEMLSATRHIDIVSIGSSQLTQERFGEDWGDLPNGGGVPVNSEIEFRWIAEAAQPLLVRAYSGTQRVRAVAEMLDRTINNCWHALSIWWFNQLDGRGPLPLLESIREHVETIRYLAGAKKPFEPNVPHHFAFRGADDLTYVASGVLAARLAKRLGIQTLILQNMLNTPKATDGLRDLVKARALLQLTRELEDERFRVIYQPRAGLDYFSPDVNRAKAQLAAVTALMRDVDPDDEWNPPIVHVVSYSEAVELADPLVINESARITRAAYHHYPMYRREMGLEHIVRSRELNDEVEEIKREVKLLLQHMETHIPMLYTPEGLYRVFSEGYFPVPYLWGCRTDFPKATNWTVCYHRGGFVVTNSIERPLSLRERLQMIECLSSSQMIP